MRMAPLPAALAGAAAAAPLLAWRIDAEGYAATWHSGIGAERFGGRWNPKGRRAVYCSLDPATCLVEAAVHRGFMVLDTRPHVLSCLQINPLPDGQPGVQVVMPEALPNPAWLHGGVPGAGQQRFGAGWLASPGVLVIASAVSRHSWNLVFSPDVAGARVRLLQQQRLVIDTRLNPAAA